MRLVFNLQLFGMDLSFTLMPFETEVVEEDPPSRWGEFHSEPLD